jgi:hypothetical protein
VEKLLGEITPDLDEAKLHHIRKLLTDPTVFTYSNRPRCILADFEERARFIHGFIPFAVHDHTLNKKQMKAKLRLMTWAIGFWAAELYYNPELLEKVERLAASKLAEL